MAGDTNVFPSFLVKEIRQGTQTPGMLHDRYFEEMPTFEVAQCEIAYPDQSYGIKSGGGDQKLNCQIVFGRDRPSHLLSGYGKIGGQPCASIDIVAGRMSSLNKRKGIFRKTLEPLTRDTLVGNNFFSDASRIYISQKCDIDHYFGLAPGDFGRPKGEAGIGIKSDHIRVIGRNSIKICAGASRAEKSGLRGELDSNGEPLVDPRIELIASSKDPQPIVKGGNLVEFLEKLLDRLGEIEQAFMIQNINLIKMQGVLANGT